MTSKNIAFTTHFDGTEEEKKLFIQLKGKMALKQKTLREWFWEKVSEEVYGKLED